MKESAHRPMWIDVALSIRAFHIARLKGSSNWRIEDTARELNRSYGSVCQYLQIASFLRTHENQIRKMETMKEAVSLVKKIKRQMEVSE